MVVICLLLYSQFIGREGGREERKGSEGRRRRNQKVDLVLLSRVGVSKKGMIKTYFMWDGDCEVCLFIYIEKERTKRRKKKA